MWKGHVELTDQQFEYIVELTRTGLYGENADAVVKELIMASLRAAMRDGFIKPLYGKIVEFKPRD